MNSGRLICASVVVAAALSATAQTSSPDTSSFTRYRQQLLDNYNSYRNKLLDDYDKFLDGVWDDFNQFKGETRDPKPKPKTAPVAEPIAMDPPEAAIPEPEVAPKPEESPKPEEKPQAKATPTVVPIVPTIPTPSSPVISAPTTAPTPEPPPTPAAPRPLTRGFSVDFYGMTVELPRMEFQILDEINATSDFATQWRSLDQQNVAKTILPAIDRKAKEMGLNDYLKFTLIMSAINQRFADAPQASRLSLAHYLLAHLGYDARIAMTDTREGLLLLPVNQMIYARPYLEINGKRFYIFCDKAETLPNPESRISTCRLPKEADQCQALDLLVGELNLPYSPHNFKIEYDGMTLQGEVNANLFPLLYRYPQMDMADYALSAPSQTIRQQLVEQVKSSLKGLDKRKAIDKLLHFIQNGFDYATDDEAHGFEKPYFVEEMLYYPQCDCEDRSIFYTYLLWNALGVENHLLNYPGHESAAVKLPDGKGASYEWKGGRYFISDPTFIGAPTGMCMPEYIGTPPKVDFAYPE